MCHSHRNTTVAKGVNQELRVHCMSDVRFDHTFHVCSEVHWSRAIISG